jgi:hypothetical protein
MQFAGRDPFPTFGVGAVPSIFWLQGILGAFAFEELSLSPVEGAEDLLEGNLCNATLWRKHGFRLHSRGDQGSQTRRTI